MKKYTEKDIQVGKVIVADSGIAWMITKVSEDGIACQMYRFYCPNVSLMKKSETYIVNDVVQFLTNSSDRKLI